MTENLGYYFAFDKELGLSTLQTWKNSDYPDIQLINKLGWYKLCLIDNLVCGLVAIVAGLVLYEL